MILKGSQRGHAKQLAQHLLNTDDNDFIDVHEVSGFLSDDVTGAFKEIQAIAKGTQCDKPFFSVSLNPPMGSSVTVAMFEDAADRIAKAHGLAGQPRVIIFHEKEGRRHAHVVWSRIDAATMTAHKLSFFKNRLQVISRALFLEHGWEMPPGLEDRFQKSPDLVDLAEWQEAKRLGKNAIDQKTLIRRCWEQSDSRASFEAALREHGFRLARGDRRSHVLVCHDGQIIAVTRAVGERIKQVRARLGEADDLPSVDEALAALEAEYGPVSDEGSSPRFDQSSAKPSAIEQKRAELDQQREEMIALHRQEREALKSSHAERWARERETRQDRLKAGLAGLWQRATGQRRKIIAQNIEEVEAARSRDRAEMQDLIDEQLAERRGLEALRTVLRQHALGINIDSEILIDLGLADPRQTFVPQPEDLPFTLAQLKVQPDRILDYISHKRADFSEGDIKRTLARFIEETGELRVAVDRALTSSKLARVPDDPARLTTRDYRAAENALEGTAHRLAKARGFAVQRHHVKRAIVRRNTQMKAQFGGKLSAEQRKAIDHVLSDQALSCVVGLAGSGKSTMLATVREAYEAQGIKVHGAALAGKAADGLASASGTESRTLASLEASWQNGYASISRGDVLIVDEAGMVGTRQLKRVAEKIEEIGAKLVLIGDPDQLQPIEAGTPFEKLIETHGAAYLRHIHRQKSAWQRRASEQLAAGELEQAFAAYNRRGKIHQTNGSDAAIARLAQDYLADGAPGDNKLAFAHRRRDVYALNQAIRVGLQDIGALGDEHLFQTETGKRAFGVGDRILFTRNDRQLGLTNGLLGTVRGVSENRIAVEIDGEDGKRRRVTFNPKNYTAFDHGYAVTIHKAQGATVDRSFVLAFSSMSKSLAYVAMTRHRQSMELFINAADQPAWASDKAGREERIIEQLSRYPKPLGQSASELQHHEQSQCPVSAQDFDEGLEPGV